MRETSNPVFRSLPKQQGGYAQFGTGVAGAAQQVGYQTEPYTTQYPPQTGVSRPLTIDDVVTKTGITLAVLSAVAVVSYFRCRPTPRWRCPSRWLACWAVLR